MKKQSITLIYLLAIFFSMLTIQPAMAQDGFEDDVVDVDEEEPAAPINDYILVGIAVGSIFGYRSLTQKSLKN